MILILSAFCHILSVFVEDWGFGLRRYVVIGFKEWDLCVDISICVCVWIAFVMGLFNCGVSWCKCQFV